MVKAVPVKTSLVPKKPRKPRVTKKAETMTSTTETMSPEQRYQMIQSAAYLIAEKDGFQPGKEQDYWLQAERELESQLSPQGSLDQDTDERDIH